MQAFVVVCMTPLNTIVLSPSSSSAISASLSFSRLRQIERLAGFRRDEHGAAGIDELRLRPVAHVSAERGFVDVLGAGPCTA